MGAATITNNLGLGRYRIKIDSGEERRLALVAAANDGLILIGPKITSAYEQVQLADALEAQARENIKLLIDALILENDPVAAELAQAVLAGEQKKYAALVASNQPVRQQLATLKNAQADLIRQRDKWETLQAITYKEAWCTDYTIDASTSGALAPRATIDIPGDPTLTLLAPGCRSRRLGDGNISSARKAAALSNRANQLIRAEQDLADINAQLTTARADETTLKAETTAAQAAYVATPTEANYSVFERKTAELAAKRHDIANLTLSGQRVAVTVGRLNREIAYWTARPATEVPDPGDGAFLERELISPAQAYFNAAIFPGWQKWMPTYRWGTASNVNETANTMDVTLGAATSSAQRLNVNKESSLSNVPVVYMTCHASAFEDGDRVIVAFANQLFESPSVIGFLDNPRECRAWPTSVIMDLYFETLPGPSPGTRQWANVIAWYEEGPEAGCSGANYNLAVVPYTANICESAFHLFRLERPAFAVTADEAHFDLNVNDGNFSTLWVGNSSAWLYDTAINSNRVPGGSSPANSIGLDGSLAPNYIRVVERTTSAFTQSITHASNFSSAPGECTYIQPSTTGAWLHPGTNVASEQPPSDVTYPLGEEARRADEFLNSMSAMPTSITVTRKRGGRSPKTYVLDSIGEDSTLPFGGRRWRFDFRREDA